MERGYHRRETGEERGQPSRNDAGRTFDATRPSDQSIENVKQKLNKIFQKERFRILAKGWPEHQNRWQTHQEFLEGNVPRGLKKEASFLIYKEEAANVLKHTESLPFEEQSQKHDEFLEHVSFEHREKFAKDIQTAETERWKPPQTAAEMQSFLQAQATTGYQTSGPQDQRIRGFAEYAFEDMRGRHPEMMLTDILMGGTWGVVQDSTRSTPTYTTLANTFYTNCLDRIKTGGSPYRDSDKFFRLKDEIG